MADIRTFLEKIKSAIYGKEVRQAIYEGIRCCYEDGKAGSTDIAARDAIDQVQAEVNKGLVRGSYSCQDLADVHQAILAEVVTMSIDSVKTVGVRLSTDDLNCAGRLIIYLGLDTSGKYVANAELVTTDGHRLYTSGYVDAGALLDEMVFTEWEWENPPVDGMNKEYCTTERYMTMPVYVRRMRFDKDTKPDEAEGMYSISFDVTGYPKIVSLTGMFSSETYGADDRIQYVQYEPCAVNDRNITLEATVFRNESDN